jgi:antirestriction protein ArdC
MTTTSTKVRADVHSQVTDTIIRMLESADQSGGAFPWCRPGISHSRPTNALTQKRYRGINVFTLWGTADAANYRSGLWATLKQWNELGARVKKGERASPIVFYKPLEIEDETERNNVREPETKTIRMAKGYWAFNADQVDGYDLPALPTVDLTTHIEAAETFVANLKIPITHGGARAFYRPSEDRIQIPERVLFQNTDTSTATEGYYGVLFHECGHASGADHRLKRDLSGRFGTASYAIEELVAEWIAAMLCADLAITAQPRPDHAHYISNWLTALRSDKAAAMAAAATASRAVEYLHGLQPDTASSASRQHFIDAGRYLTASETEVAS